MEISNYKKKNIETKYINNMQNIKLLKIKNSLLKLEKKKMQLKDTELKKTEK